MTEETTTTPAEKVESSITIKFTDGLVQGIDCTGTTPDLALVLACEQIKHALLSKPLSSALAALQKPQFDVHENGDQTT